MILFETTMSVFELMWDIALAIFILRIAFTYFLLSFLTGCMIAYFRLTRLEPINHLTQPQAELATLPLFLIMNTLWARHVIVTYEIPRVRGFRLAVGAVALYFMVVAELVGGLVMWREGWRDWIWETDPVAAGAGAVVLLLFGLMPTLLLFLEKELDEMGGTYHGHEKKSIIAAVPTVEKIEKTQQNGKKNI